MTSGFSGICPFPCPLPVQRGPRPTFRRCRSSEDRPTAVGPRHALAPCFAPPLEALACLAPVKWRCVLWNPPLHTVHSPSRARAAAEEHAGQTSEILLACHRGSCIVNLVNAESKPTPPQPTPPHLSPTVKKIDTQTVARSLLIPPLVVHWWLSYINFFISLSRHKILLRTPPAYFPQVSSIISTTNYLDIWMCVGTITQTQWDHGFHGGWVSKTIFHHLWDHRLMSFFECESCRCRGVKARCRTGPHTMHALAL